MADEYLYQSQSQSTEAMLNKLYDSSLASQKETLQQNYDKGVSDLDYQRAQSQKQTDTNLNRTYVEAAKAAKNYGEVQNAYGLTSGAMAQAKLAQDTTLQKDLTALRGIHAQTEANLERQRGLLAKEYASAIAKAQADNDMARAEALYQAAKDEEERMLQVAMTIAQMEDDSSLLAQLYGLTGLLPEKSSGGGGSSSSSSSSKPKKELNVPSPEEMTAGDAMWYRNS